MYHETFHQIYADALDGWMEQRVSPTLLMGDYYWKNGKRTIIIWRGSDGYVPTIEAYRVYDNNEIRDYGGFEGYINPPGCDEW